MSDTKTVPTTSVTSNADRLLKAVAETTFHANDVNAASFESYTREEDGQQIWPLWFAGCTAQGARFDVMFEFLTKPDRTSIELLKRALIDVCLEASNAIEKGTL